MTLARDSLLLAHKDLRIELRSRAGLAATLTLGASALMIVGLAAGPDLAQLRSLAPALTAIAVLFAALVMAERLDAIDREREALDGLWLCLSDRRAAYLGKTLAMTVLLSTLGLTLWLLAFVMLDVRAGASVLGILPLVLLSSCSMASATALVVAIVGAGDRRALLLPVLLLPMLVPTLLATVNGSRALLESDPTGVLGWIVVLAAEAALFIGLGLLTYELVAAPE